MSSPILVGLDPERGDTAPLALGAFLARIFGAPLVTLAAYRHDAVTNAITSPLIERELRDAALEKLEAMTADADADLIVMGGASPPRVLHDAAVELGAKVVVVGSTHRGAIGRIAPGSTAERLLHASPCPVAVTPAGLEAGWEPQRVGVGFVDLDEGRAALRAAAAIARAAGAALHATSAIEPLEWGQSSVLTPQRIEGRLETSRMDAEETLEAALGALGPDLDAEGDVVVARPVEALVELSGRVDLLVCGSRGYGPVRSVLLGGVTHPLIAQARCPVVIVPRGVEAALEPAHGSGEAAAT